jgi:hypothetical protein
VNYFRLETWSSTGIMHFSFVLVLLAFVLVLPRFLWSRAAVFLGSPELSLKALMAYPDGLLLLL